MYEFMVREHVKKVDEQVLCWFGEHCSTNVHFGPFLCCISHPNGLESSPAAKAFVYQAFRSPADKCRAAL
jgi:hypothetical protein